MVSTAMGTQGTNVTTPQGATSQRTTPQGATPLGATSQGATPQGATPQGATPQGATPLGATSQGATPQGATSQGVTPQGATSQGATSQGATPQAAVRLQRSSSSVSQGSLTLQPTSSAQVCKLCFFAISLSLPCRSQTFQMVGKQGMTPMGTSITWTTSIRLPPG